MPDQTIRIQCGSFRADVRAEALSELPRANARKLFRLMRQGENQNDLQLGRTLRRIESEYKAAEADAQMREKLQWRFVPNRSMKPEHIDVRANNRQLRENTKQARAALIRVRGLLAVYNEFFNEKYGGN